MTTIKRGDRVVMRKRPIGHNRPGTVDRVEGETVYVLIRPDKIVPVPARALEVVP